MQRRWVNGALARGEARAAFFALLPVLGWEWAWLSMEHLYALHTAVWEMWVISSFSMMGRYAPAEDGVALRSWFRHPR